MNTIIADIEERNLNTWREMLDRANQMEPQAGTDWNAHVSQMRREPSVHHDNPQLSFIAWARMQGVEIKPVVRDGYSTRTFSNYPLYEYSILRGGQRISQTNTFHGAVEIACFAIFGKL